MPIDQFGRPLPYTDSREVYSVPPTGGVPVMPRFSGIPPRPPVDPNDLLAVGAMEQDAARSAMRPDLGVGAQPPRDPFYANLPPRQAQDPATQAAITRLRPSRTEAFSERDAQALATLDPRALDEARQREALSKPKTITGSFGGRSFEMTPAARVDRNVLAQIYNKYLQKQGQEREDAVRGQEQSGRERIVTIPGEQATQREKIRAEAAAAEAAAARAASAPEQQARIAKSQAETEAARARAGREQAEFAERVTPEQAAIDAAYERALASPFAQTPAGRAAISRLAPRTTAGRTLPPPDAAALGEGAAGPGADSGTIAAEVMADPGIAGLIQRVKETEPGLFTGSRGRQTSTAARLVAERAIRARFQRAGLPPEEADALITSILGPSAGDRTGTGVGSLAGLLPPMLQNPARLGGAAMAAAQ